MVSRIDLGPGGGPYVEIDEDNGDLVVRTPNDTIDFNAEDLTNIGTATLDILNVDVENLADSATDPSSNGEFRRNGTDVKVQTGGTVKNLSDIEPNTDTRINVSDDGTEVVSEPTDVNFGDNVSVTDDGDGTVTIDATDTTEEDTRVNVSDNGIEVVSEPTDISFDANLDVTDDGDGTVSIDASGGSGEIQLKEYQTASDLPDPDTETTPTIAYVVDEDDYVGLFQA